MGFGTGLDWASRTLPCGDGLDDDSIRLSWIEWLRRPSQGMLHECPNRRGVQDLRFTNDNAAYGFPGALEEMPWIGQPGSAQEEEVDPTRIHGNRKDGVRRALGRTKSDDQGVVVVIDQFDRARKACTHLRQNRSGPCGDLRCIFGNEPVELVLGGQIFHGRRSPLISPLPMPVELGRQAALPVGRCGM